MRSAIAVLLLAAAPVSAQELPSLAELQAPCAPHVPEDQRRGTVAEGVWFHPDLARCMLLRLRLLPEYARGVELMEQRAALVEARTALLREQVAVAEREAALARETLSTQVERARRAESRESAWFRSPVFLVGVGVALTVLVEVAAIAVLNALESP
jgi:hypothetical protein